MTKVLRIVGLSDGLPTSVDGQYLKFYDPDGNNGMGKIKTTPNVNEALEFPTIKEALEFYRQSSSVRPFRPDGKLNRPLTAFTMEFLNKGQ